MFIILNPETTLIMLNEKFRIIVIKYKKITR